MHVICSERVEQHCVRHRELRDEPPLLSHQNALQLRRRRRLAVARDDAHAVVVDATPPCTPRHLGVLRGHQAAEGSAVILAYAVEDDGAGWHVDAHCEGLSRKEHLG